MAETLDMTLDDIIKNNKKSNPSSDGVGCRREGHRGSAVGDDRGSSRGIGPTRHAFKRSGNRVVPYQPSKAPDSVWQHDMYSEVIVLSSSNGKRVSAIETDTKLYISNVDFGVSIEDIKELFSELGDLKRSSIHYDRSGRSKGTAEVVFARRGDAVAAVKKYNNVQLDGKPMKIEILGTNIPTAHKGVAQLVCCRVDPVLGVGGGVAAAVAAADLVVVVAKNVVSQSLRKSLMPTWRSTMQMRCRLTRYLRNVDISTSNMDGVSPFVPAICATVFKGQQTLCCGALGLLNFMGFMCLRRTRVKWMLVNTVVKITCLPLVSVPFSAK